MGNAKETRQKMTRRDFFVGFGKIGRCYGASLMLKSVASLGWHANATQKVDSKYPPVESKKLEKAQRSMDKLMADPDSLTPANEEEVRQDLRLLIQQNLRKGELTKVNAIYSKEQGLLDFVFGSSIALFCQSIMGLAELESKK